MRFYSALFTTILLFLAVICTQAAILQRPRRELQAVEVTEGGKDQIPVAVIEVQEPDTVVQSLQVDTAIQTTFGEVAETEREQEPEIELKDELPTEAVTSILEQSTEADKVQPEIVEIATEIRGLLEAEFKKTESPVTDLIEKQQKTFTSAPDVLEQGSLITQDQTPEPSELVPKKEQLLPTDASLDKETITETDVEAAVRQASTAIPTTTQQNFVQFIQNTPIGQFFTQLTGGQQQQQPQQSGVGQSPAGAASDEQSVTPTVPVFLNPGVALTQAQQAVQNAAQSVVNTTSQAFQGLQQFASNIGNQFQNTISSLSGQNPQGSTTARPPGPIQAIVSNFVGGGTQATPTSAPVQQQGPFQGIISFFQGGPRPQNNAGNQGPNQLQNQASNNKPLKPDEVNQDKPSLDDKIENQESVITNEVRNSEETIDSFEEAQSGQDMIVVNDDANVATEQIKVV